MYSTMYFEKKTFADVSKDRGAVFFRDKQSKETTNGREVTFQKP
jgi:hypothetical protein